MSEPLLPKQVEDFISASIESVAQLEALLLMRSDRGHSWTSQELAAQLYIKEKEAASVLAALASRQLCREDRGAYQYHPESEEVESDIELLAETYRQKLILVTNLIHQRSKRPAAQQFADVFRFRKDES